ncbi:HAD superfamily hydrolase (TIGR01509 family)/HAD superfamily hydrolase (TIGR01549 family) [Planomicrobium soli]|uniref:HAD superfamily hydrolase (TIGR01509 family)/HAD superfamily hydrolase (TIGR01549 family) n=1 Tax=Planomicrobium soli TaxID=1176648 RepID=A0A2P8H610_9BACL|nr:HAD family hydrolase [Planomicrobium soli]PSL41656.1 HAD superfamily hydrolase (TIGR01509 family)/HAD superfamily hydrolase (TIGR01549 family) [Planomicrobium soli]
MIKGIIFDFDGLIFDTETHQFTVYQEIFAEHGTELPIARWQQEIGTHSGFSALDYLEELLERKVEQDVLREQFSKKYHAKMAEEKARAGVEDYLKAAKEQGLKIGLASSSNFQWVTSNLKKLGLYEYFECIKTSDDVENVKPDPALYLLAAECLGLSTEECLVFEDSANGALAAKRAGMNCVIVPNPVTHTMDFCHVEHRLDSMADMTLNEVLNYVNNIKVPK